jgi:hypothetical protein
MNDMHLNLWKFRGVLLALVVAPVAQSLFAGQPVLMDQPAVITESQWSQEDDLNNPLQVFQPSGEAASSLPQPFKLGPVVARPHPFYRFLYGSGIQNGANNQQDSIIQEFSPGISVDLGKHWTADYTPTFRFYSNNQFKDTVDHSASLSGGTRYEDWRVGFQQTFSLTTTPLAETAAQTEQESYVTSLSASYAINNKYSADFGLNQNLNFVTGLQNSKTWSTLDWLNYQFFERFSGGIGLGGGYVNIDNPASPDQMFEQAQLRMQWRVTDRLSLSVSGGLEDRQFIHAPGAADSLNPLFGVSLQYQPFEHTKITLGANRAVNSSDYFILAQSTETTSVNLNFNQRLLEEFYLDLGAGYSRMEYIVALGPFSNLRTDDNFNFNARLSHGFLKRGNVSLTYQYGDNESSQAGFSYRSNQIGFEIGFSY